MHIINRYIHTRLTAVLIRDVYYGYVRKYTNTYMHTFPSNPDILDIPSNKKRGKTVMSYNEYVTGVAPRMFRIVCWFVFYNSTCNMYIPGKVY